MSPMYMNKLIVIFLLVCLAASLASCSIGLRLRYDDGQKYEAGEFRDLQGIRILDVDWVSGSVHVITDNVSGISATESSGKKIPSELVMRYWVDGDTLRIRFGKDGARLRNNFQKDLVITVPEKILFSVTSFDSASADIIYPKINAGILEISSASGSVEAEGIAKEIRLETVSGVVRAEFSGFDSAQFNTVSGNIDCLMLTQGSIRIDSVSGDIHANMTGVPDVKAETVSGSVTLSMQEGTGFTAKLSSLSGKIAIDFPYNQSGDQYVSGDGTGDIKVSTTSGDITLMKG